jgi:hypothetical protein
MGLITGTILATKASLLLQDTTNIRWTSDELLGWINSGQKEIVLYKPNSSVVNSSIATVAGTKQKLPTAAPVGLQVIDVIRNMGVTPGTTPGLAITLVPREILDGSIPNWHSTGASLVVKHFVFDSRDPKTFYVYPPLLDATQFLEVSMSVVPADLAAIAGTITLDDIYESALIDYILYRAYSKDAEHSANAERATKHQQAFMQAVGGKVNAETAFAPTGKFTKKA